MKFLGILTGIIVTVVVFLLLSVGEITFFLFRQVYFDGGPAFTFFFNVLEAHSPLSSQDLSNLRLDLFINGVIMLVKIGVGIWAGIKSSKIFLARLWNKS